MKPQHYRTAAAELRALADRLEQRAEANTAQQRRSRTLAVHAVAHAAKRLFVRHTERTLKPSSAQRG